jgi:crotonobetainyl-CoA:carnitine CoA-transferase CaiB-like acyl-CoA transferase
MQGKESLSIDLGTDEGAAVIHQLVKQADVVLQAFRAGAATRARIDSATLRALNPSLVYVNAPGYGIDGPYGTRPAYAPSIGAASGIALTDAPGASHATSSMAEIKQAAAQLSQAAAVVPLQADGLAALGVASTILLGLLARARGRATGDLTATMLGTSMLAVQEHLTDYEGRPSPPQVDDLYLGYGALYRMYETSDGWVMLAAPSAHEWPDLVRTLGLDADLEGRDTELAKTLEGIFATRPAAEWEDLLSSADLGCVRVHEGSPQALMLTDEQLSTAYTATATSPVYDEHPRLKPLVSFSRSQTRTLGFQSLGDSNDAVLTELGFAGEQIADLRARKVIG